MNATQTTVAANQLLYTRVEPAYSAQGKGGFQTVYKTPSLSANEVTAIENRVQSFAPMEMSQVRYQFLRLESGSFVITHSCRIESHVEITDAERRRGAFIAHCLLISPTEFAKVQNNPFTLFANFDFIGTPTLMVENFGRATGIAPVATIAINRSYPITAATTADWKAQEISKLVALAESATNFQPQHQSIQILGEHTEVLAALALAFHLIHQQTRTFCSFDTYAENASTKPGDYWAMGRTQRQSRIMYTVNASNQRVEGQNLPSLSNADFYLGWLKVALAKQTLEAVLLKTASMQQIDEAFATQNPLLLSQIESSLYDEFTEMHQDVIINRLQEAFRQFVRPELVTSLTNHLLKHGAPLSNLQLAAQHKLDSNKAADVILIWINDAKPQLQDKEWQQLQSLAQQVGNPMLFYLASSLCKKPNHKAQKEALAHMDETKFQQVLSWLLKPIPPAEMVTAAHLPLLLNDKQLAQMTNEQLVELVRAIVEMGEMRHLSSVTQYIDRLENQNLAQVEKTIKKATAVPTQFSDVVAQQRKKLGKPKSFLQKLFRRR